MSKMLIRVGGAAAVVSGGLSITQQVWDVAAGGLTEGRGESAVHTTQMLLLVPAVMGLYLAQQRAMRGFGQAATLAALLGSTLMFGSALTEVTLLPELTAAGSPLADDPGVTAGAVFLASFVVWVAGLLLFGMATWSAGVLPRPAAALLVVGLLLGLGLNGVVPAVLVIYSAGLVWLGLAAAVRINGVPDDSPQPVLVRP
jgi:hypothetical protein